MATRILAGKKINESGKEGAVFYDSTTGKAFGPVFGSADEAERFMEFLAGVDPRVLPWENFSTDPYVVWLREDRPARRRPFQFSPDFIHDTVRDDEDDMGDLASMSCSLTEQCFPLFNGYDNHQVLATLRHAGVVGPEVSDIEAERSCVYAYFRTRADGHAFLDKLNRWLRDNWHRAYPTKN